MSNKDFPFGAELIQKDGSVSHTLKYEKLADTHTTINRNDLLELRSDGFVHRAQNSSTTIIGIAAEYKAANTGGTIAFHPVNLMSEFIMQSDDDTIDAQTDFNLNYNIAVGAPVADPSSPSQMQVDGSTGATTATLPIKVLGIYERKLFQNDNDLGDKVVVRCRFNATALYAGGAGI